MKTVNDENVVRTLKGSLESTSKGLSLFTRSLKGSGFEEAIPKYRQLQAVLVQQRLWCTNKGCNELDSLWQEIAKQSDHIYNMLFPLAEVMRGLRSIDSLTQKEEAERLQTEILKILSEPQPISLLRLSKMLGYEKKRVIAETHNLMKNGIVEKRGKGNGTSYRLRIGCT